MTIPYEEAVNKLNRRMQFEAESLSDFLTQEEVKRLQSEEVDTSIQLPLPLADMGVSPLQTILQKIQSSIPSLVRDDESPL